MKTKINKLTSFLMILTLSLTVIPTNAFAKTIEPTTVSANPKEIPAEVKIMLNRLEEIKAMDKSDLSSSEKKVLRKEVKAIKSSLKATGNGVYLSVGAIIIIVLLLILIL
ncbi:hypothetical protein [Flavobacterium sp.]|uniref:hypothetical protein n=1 Tax=Flavobacterium sp. TaxID=239 RepID=UPI0037522CA7